ncbi:MAG: hypothetical protein UV65_C0020G0007 [Parcubacteria group bacterium GW2011_GWF2_43_11]|nr:MAG: hypothetical protein UV65_C0020G0007 [Parcubacteria group bacterium GW2011_GWF2_43_11]
MDKNFTLVIIKPDAIKKGLIQEVASRICQQNLRIIRRKEILINLEFLKKLYQWQVLFYPTEIEEYLCATPLPVWLIEGRNAVEKVLKIKVEIRAEFGVDELHTLLHCPDSEEDFQRESALFFSGETLKMETTKTNNQIEVFLFKQLEEKGTSFLLLKRSPEKGGFWQPITGNVQKEESFEEAALREIQEETGVSRISRLTDTDYSFDFFDDNRWQHERVFGAQLDNDVKIVLSREHTEFKWATKEEALNEYLKWPGNKEGLRRLAKTLGI